MIIAGVDPGTTVGWALLDISGNLIASGFEKELDLNSLVAKLPGKKLRSRLPFACVESNAEVMNEIALVERLWLEKARRQCFVLEKVVSEYKKERSSHEFV